MGTDYTLKFKDLVIGFTSEFQPVWDDKGSGADEDGAFYRPVPPDGFHAVGHLGVRGYGRPKDAVMLVVKDAAQGQPPALAKPDDYEQILEGQGLGRGPRRRVLAAQGAQRLRRARAGRHQGL